jgi:glucose-1-phosphate thymidylyltransferase
LLAQYLLGGLHQAGVERIVWVIDRGKTDIVRHFASGGPGEPLIAYVATTASPGVIHTVNTAFPLLDGCRVVFGFPDIIFEPTDALQRLVQRLDAGGADVVLAACPTPQHQIADRIALGDGDRVARVVVKPTDGALSLAWFAAAWQPTFTRFLHAQCAATSATNLHSVKPGSAKTGEGSRPAFGERYLGHAVHSAIEAGLAVCAVTFQHGSFVDAGTASGLDIALSRYGHLPLATPPV